MSNELSEAGLRRLAQVAGIRRISDDAVQFIGQYANYLTQQFGNAVAILLEGSRRKTLNVEIAQQALKTLGITLYSAGGGYVACKSDEEMRKGIRSGNCLFIARAKFQRLLRQYVGENYRLSQVAVEDLQFALENELIKTLASANDAAAHAGRQTVFSTDLAFVVEHACEVATGFGAGVGARRQRRQREFAAALP